MNISEHIDDFIQEMTRRNYSQNTIDNYASCAKVFFEQSTKDHPKNINEADIKAFLAKASMVNTQRNYHSAIKKFYEICMGQPKKFKYIPYARKEQKLPIVLSREEVVKIIEGCTNIKHKAILCTLYSTGMRVSELLNLKWSNIDRSRGVINIIQAKGKKDRQVPLSPTLIKIFIAYYKEYRTKEYIFEGQFGGPYSQKSVLEVVKQAAQKAGIHKHVYTHLMRHNCFTHLLEAGTDLYTIQKIAGHNSPKTTQLYARISHSIISKVITPLDQL